MSAESHKSMSRQTNIELLRCLLMFLIVLYHCSKFGVFDDLQEQWRYSFQTALMWHVDCFVAISGWFGIQLSVRKYFKIWAVVAFYSVVSMIWLLCVNGHLAISDIRLRGGWFVETYFALMLMAPFVNAAIEKLFEKGANVFWNAWGCFALMMTATWAPFHFGLSVAPGGVWGDNLMVLLFVYVTARGLRLSNVVRLPKKLFFIGFGLYVGLSILAINVGGGRIMRYFEYNSPMVWTMAMLVLLFFAMYVKPGPHLGRFVNFCAPSMFAVYLLHGPCPFGHDLYRETQAKLVSFLPKIHPISIIILSAIVVFAFCIGVDLIRRVAISGFARLSVRIRANQEGAFE